MLAIAGLFGSMFSGAANDILNVIGGAIVDALKGVVTYVCTFWVRIPTPELAGSSGTASAPVSYLQSHLHWFVGAAAVASIMFGVGRMVWESRLQHGADLLKGILLLIIVSGASLTIIQLLVTVSDDFSTWIMGQALGGVGSAELAGAFGAQMGAMLGASTLVGGPVPIMLAIVLGSMALVGSIIQAFLMVVRGGMLVILAGVLPLCFSFWSTESGKNWSKRSVSWLVAFVLYKPAAAIVYATAFQLVSTTGGAGGIANVFTGITLLFMAVLALPALLRFVTPLVAGVASGGAGMAMGVMTGLGASAMMPTGAMAVAASPVSSAGSGTQAATGAVPVGAAASASGASPSGGGSAFSQRAQLAAVGGQVGSSLEGAAGSQAGEER
jgi:type IV secretion system protein TrbL